MIDHNLPTKIELLCKDLVSINKSHSHATANTIKIADYFGKRPSDINRRISNLVRKGLCKIAPTYYLDPHGRKQKYYELNRQQFAQVVLGFTGDKADRFRLQYTEAFEQKDKELKEWRAGRRLVSETTKIANDSIYWLQIELKKVIPESKRCTMLFIHIQRAITKAVTGHANTDRAELNTAQLKSLDSMESLAREAIERFRKAEMPPEQIRDEVLAMIKSGENYDARKNPPRRQSEAGFQCAQR